MAETTDIDPEVQFEWDTAPEYVRVALGTACSIAKALRLDEITSARLVPIMAAMHHPDVMQWLREHGYLRPDVANALVISLAAFRFAHASSDI